MTKNLSVGIKDFVKKTKNIQNQILKDLGKILRDI